MQFPKVLMGEKGNKKERAIGILYLIVTVLVIFRLFAYLSCFKMGAWTVYAFTMATALFSFVMVILCFPELPRGLRILWTALFVSVLVSWLTHFTALEYICNTAIFLSYLTILPKIKWGKKYTDILFIIFTAYTLFVTVFVNRDILDMDAFVYMNPNVASLLFVVYQFVLIAYARKQKNLALKITFYILGFALVLVQWQFGGRGALLGTLTLALYCIFQRYFDKFSRIKIKWLIVGVCAFSLVFALFYSVILYPKLGDDFLVLGKDLFTGRENIWLEAFKSLKGGKIFLGTGQLRLIIPWDNSPEPTNLHSSMLGYLALFGVFSATFYALLLGSLTARAGKTNRKTTVAFIVAMIVLSWFETFLYSTNSVLYFPIALTLIYNFDNEEGRKEMTIHYVWLGKGEKSNKIKYCIESWKQKCPDARIIEWNEDNYDIRKNKYISEAYDSKKYAFVADYIRFDILYSQGGVYMDTDVELLKDISPLLDKPFMGFERAGEVAPGLIMNALGGEEVLKEIIEYYDNLDGFSTDKTVVEITSEILQKHGLENADSLQEVAGFIIYPTEYFNPKGGDYGKEKITKNTYSIHHYEASWKSPLDQLIMSYKVKYGVKKGKILFTLRHPFKAMQKWREK